MILTVLLGGLLLLGMLAYLFEAILPGRTQDSDCDQE